MRLYEITQHNTSPPTSRRRPFRRDVNRPDASSVHGPRVGADPYRALSSLYVASATTAPTSAGITNPNNKVSMRRIVHGTDRTCNSIVFPNV